MHIPKYAAGGGGMEIVMKKKQTRSEARAEAFKLIFESEINSESPEYLIEAMLEDNPKSESNINYIKTVYLGVLAKKDEIDKMIEDNMTFGWKLERISKVALAVLRMAVFEILYVEDVPERVAINEAVEIDKKYDEPDNSAFVNGILGGIIKKL